MSARAGGLPWPARLAASSPLAACLLGWALATGIVCVAVHRAYGLDVDEAHPRAVVGSVWYDGKLLAREVIAAATDERILRAAPDGEAQLTSAMAAHPGATLVRENVVAEGAVATWSEAALALSFVSGHDGIAVTLANRTAYLTPDDLLARQLYDKGVAIESVQLTAGLDMPLALAALADQLGTTVRDLLDHGTLRRIRVVRRASAAGAGVTADALTHDAVRDAAFAAGRYLARSVDADGRFRYLVDAPTNRTLPGYDWPRHAGATYFLAQVASRSGDTQVAWAALRAAGWLRDHAMVRCGEHRCIGDTNVVDVGSTALSLLAFVEVARSGLDAGYSLVIPGLTDFLRAQQRPDGEFMHLYDRAARAPIDTQLLYYSGEAAFALSRAHSLLHDPADLDAATRALAHLTSHAWTFFGGRYYWGEEHWTCQAMDDLWDRAPSPAALQFCLDWQAFNRKLQYGPGETVFDAEGAYGVGPLVTPRLTPVGSRAESGIATLEAAQRAGRPPAELADLDRQMRRSLALLVRHQLRKDRCYLCADPAAIDGGMPGSEVDWQIRIDYAQHSGSAMLRWLDLGARQGPPHP
jgi:hypothetical protein